MLRAYKSHWLLIINFMGCDRKCLAIIYISLIRSILMCSCQIYYSPLPGGFIVFWTALKLNVKEWLQALSPALVSPSCILQHASLSIRAQQPDCFPKSAQRDRNRNFLFKRQDATWHCFLTFRIWETNIANRGEFWGIWNSQGIYFCFCFLSYVIKHVNKFLLCSM